MEGSEIKNSKEFQKKPSKEKRIQSGNIHICIRGNCRRIIFFDDQDKIEFLKRCNSAAIEFDTDILAFVIMDNHVHLQVVTNQLTLLQEKFYMDIHIGTTESTPYLTNYSELRL